MGRGGRDDVYQGIQEDHDGVGAGRLTGRESENVLAWMMKQVHGGPLGAYKGSIHLTGVIFITQ